jgi:hypothetical protein
VLLVVVEIVKIVIINIVKIAGSWSCIDVDICILLLLLSCCMVMTEENLSGEGWPLDQT